MKVKKMYDEIFKVLDKYKDGNVFDIDDMKSKAKCHLFGVELKEKHGLDLDPKKIRNLCYQRFGNYMYISRYGEIHNRTISWSDDGTQPEDELLLSIRFSSGAYIFGDDYPTELFQKFFIELKSYKPKYTDSHNHCLYFSMKNAKHIFNTFNDILKKYYEINKEDFKVRKIQKLKDELKNMEEGEK